MPPCVLNEKCLCPTLEVRAGHKCPMCLGCVHIFCGVEDPNCSDLHLNVTCNACVALARKEPSKETTKDTRKKTPPKKKKGSASKAKTHHQAAELVPTKLKKSPAAQAFRLTAPTGTPDSFIMKSVCFLAEDGAYGKELIQHFGGVGKIKKSLCLIDGKLYLFGNVVRLSKLPKKGNAKVVAYDVQWEDLVLGETKIDLQVVVPAIELSVAMKRKQSFLARKSGRPKKYRPTKLFDDDIVKSLFVVHEGEDGDPMDSDTTAKSDDDDENEGLEVDNDEDLFVTTDAKEKDGGGAEESSYLEDKDE